MLPTTAEKTESENRELPGAAGAVLLLPGVLVPTWVMRPFRQRFLESGYHAEICDYQSFGKDLDSITRDVAVMCNRFQESLPDGVSFDLVGHSLGGVLSRTICLTNRFERLRRVVMLAPPNRGSHVASRIGPWVRRLVPVIDDIADREDSSVNQRSLKMTVPTGIIGADPDFVVRDEALHLEDESDFISLPGPHSALIFRQAAFEQTVHFLERGRFNRES
ncbi:Alpha/beta hydrolase family protein [Thalassoglobus neptunius]|uniref:Alpha/beta hydrolase family protein n=1 Tax=Thalassoglobus neptunius TaxID=1938619 RepID=A0A5C5XA40_9PLAN|nr:alpha/beta fold hydrolase [Thalassoglobus neptunius]TWT59045.1 Alpha/beta hydrolase family protein [Thalassoglobus neptunius]